MVERRIEVHLRVRRIRQERPVDIRSQPIALDHEPVLVLHQNDEHRLDVMIGRLLRGVPGG